MRAPELLCLGLFITTEYWMPGRTGYELLKRVKVNPPHTNFNSLSLFITIEEVQQLGRREPVLNSKSVIILSTVLV
jgi:hypothetical protein